MPNPKDKNGKLKKGFMYAPGGRIVQVGQPPKQMKTEPKRSVSKKRFVGGNPDIVTKGFVKGDGNCFYHAVLLALGEDGRRELNCTGSVDEGRGEADFDCLRQLVSDLYSYDDYKKIVNEMANTIEKAAERASIPAEMYASSTLQTQAKALLSRDHDWLSCQAAGNVWGSILEAKVLGRYLLKHGYYIFHMAGGEKGPADASVFLDFSRKYKEENLNGDTRVIFLVTNGNHYEYFKFGDRGTITAREYLNDFFTPEVSLQLFA